MKRRMNFSWPTQYGGAIGHTFTVDDDLSLLCDGGLYEWAWEVQALVEDWAKTKTREPYSYQSAAGLREPGKFLGIDVLDVISSVCGAIVEAR